MSDIGALEKAAEEAAKIGAYPTACGFLRQLIADYTGKVSQAQIDAWQRQIEKWS